MAKSGNKVKILAQNEEFEGTLIESEDKDFTVIKLESGYNIGISNNKIKKIKDLGPVKKEDAKPKKLEQDKSRPKITILHTGGTIASKVDYSTGGVVGKYKPEEILEMFSELKEIANIDSRLLSNISSEQMRFDHYNIIIEAIEEEVKKGTEGIIITHGTDTMHYTSAALSFALENIPIPVILVGGQRSSDRPSTDSYSNLMSACTFITKTDFTGVAVCMHESMNDETCLILPGAKCRKMHTTRRDAFKAINAKPLARVNYESGEVEELVEYDNSGGDMKISKFNPKVKVGILKVYPNMFSDALAPYEKYDGLVMELTALGHAPSVVEDEYMKEHEKIAKAISKICSKIPVVASSQCIHGRIDMDVYSPGRKLQKLGVIGNHLDMTPETSYIKLAWLLSNYKDKKEIESLFCKNLRGEISEDISQESF